MTKINHKVFNVAKSEASKSPQRTKEEESRKIEANRNTVRRRRNSEKLHGKLEQSQKSQGETREQLMHGEQKIDPLKQENTLLQGDRDKIAEKLIVTTEEPRVLRNRVAELKAARERATKRN